MGNKKMKYAIGFIVACGIFGTMPAHADGNGFKWSCAGTGKNSMQCSIKNDSQVEASICMDVVKVCKDGDHYATLCSSRLRPGDVESKVLAKFEPKILLFEKCMGTEYRDKVISQ